MTVSAVVGAQYGDEGKGRIVDYLARSARLVVRFQGGENAGHTIVNDLGTFKLHLVPSGIFNGDATCLVGTGTVVYPPTLLEELAEIERAGVSTAHLKISDRAQLVMPYHRTLDGLEERSRGGAKIGTTGRGIGPAYADKAAREGLRVGDLLRPDYLKSRLESVLPRINRTLEFFGEKPCDAGELLAECAKWAKALSGRIVDPVPIVRTAVERGDEVLLEGQLGVMKDIDWGTYPFVTSSHPLPSYGAIGAGLPHRYITRIIGVMKAYATSVGAGPFPGELTGAEGDRLREKGGEFGATTGRPRRCGWLDTVVIRYGAWLAGFTELAVTKLDVLAGFPEVRICTGYRLPDGSTLDTVPDTPVLETVEPVFETLSGWKGPLDGVRKWNDLPKEARAFLERVEELAGVPIRMVSVGSAREAMVIRP